MHPSDSSLPARPFHTTEVRISLPLPLCGEGNMGRSCLPPQLPVFPSWGSDVMSPTSPCCQRGLRSAFITNRPCKHPEVLQARDVPTRVCVLRLPALPRCSAVQYLSGPCGDQLEGDWRINATLKQNTTCQLFTPSLPHGGRMSRFS